MPKIFEIPLFLIALLFAGSALSDDEVVSVEAPASDAFMCPVAPINAAMLKPMIDAMLKRGDFDIQTTTTEKEMCSVEQPTETRCVCSGATVNASTLSIAERVYGVPVPEACREGLAEYLTATCHTKSWCVAQFGKKFPYRRFVNIPSALGADGATKKEFCESQAREAGQAGSSHFPFSLEPVAWDKVSGCDFEGASTPSQVRCDSLPAEEMCAFANMPLTRRTGPLCEIASIVPPEGKFVGAINGNPDWMKRHVACRIVYQPIKPMILVHGADPAAGESCSLYQLPKAPSYVVKSMFDARCTEVENRIAGNTNPVTIFVWQRNWWQYAQSSLDLHSRNNEDLWMKWAAAQKEDCEKISQNGQLVARTPSETNDVEAFNRFRKRFEAILEDRSLNPLNTLTCCKTPTKEDIERAIEKRRGAPKPAPEPLRTVRPTEVVR